MFLIEQRGFLQLVIQPLQAELFFQSGLPGEQVGSQTQPVSLDGKAHGGQNGGKQIHMGILPLGGIRHVLGDLGIQKAGIHPSV